jgi:hypothetical protein
MRKPPTILTGTSLDHLHPITVPHSVVTYATFIYAGYDIVHIASAQRSTSYSSKLKSNSLNASLNA